MADRSYPSAPQSTLLRLIAQVQDDIEDGSWLPPRRGWTWLNANWTPSGTFVSIYLSGAGVAAAHAALLRAGLISASRLGRYAAKVTEAGRAQAEFERDRPVAWESRRG